MASPGLSSEAGCGAKKGASNPIRVCHAYNRKKSSEKHSGKPLLTPISTGEKSYLPTIIIPVSQCSSLTGNNKKQAVAH
jgi:hypothetical protein